MDLMEVQQAVKTRIDAALLPLLDTYAGWPDALSIPVGGAICAVVPNDGVCIEFDQTFGPVDGATVHLELHVLVAAGGSYSNAQAVLSPYISKDGTLSLREILRGDSTLSGAVRYAKPVTRVRGYGEQSLGGNSPPLFGAILDLEVFVQ